MSRRLSLILSVQASTLNSTGRSDTTYTAQEIITLGGCHSNEFTLRRQLWLPTPLGRDSSPVEATRFPTFRIHDCHPANNHPVIAQTAQDVHPPSTCHSIDRYERSRRWIEQYHPIIGVLFPITFRARTPKATFNFAGGTHHAAAIRDLNNHLIPVRDYGSFGFFRSEIARAPDCDDGTHHNTQQRSPPSHCATTHRPIAHGHGTAAHSTRTGPGFQSIRLRPGMSSTQHSMLPSGSIPQTIVPSWTVRSRITKST